jgi:hypothetical protein
VNASISGVGFSTKLDRLSGASGGQWGCRQHRSYDKQQCDKHDYGQFRRYPFSYGEGGCNIFLSTIGSCRSASEQ